MVNLNYLPGEGVVNQSITINTMGVSFPNPLSQTTYSPINFSRFPVATMITGHKLICTAVTLQLLR